MLNQAIYVTSFEDLIRQLEPVEQSEISSDIPPNVRAELKRIKRNVSLILGFLSHFPTVQEPDTADLGKAIVNVRQDCLAINATISRLMILHTLRLQRWADDNSKISEQYAALAGAMRQLCMITVPSRLEHLASSL
jgi:hypothetical protein